ncbi:cellulose binding domain-containing protein [Gilvimarinus agarilyticus]|uniref:cellulose binding domain-containing protein n=1 Tax=Gilvimarinus sp. 2_MG-2023 TaxID=3062666 RepID=UPI001C08B13D|nr:cellulose binding domain-containing protein [Gilvimarinus sp. 2_MG-2023]MBU2885234.1 cellulose binding domain-containing protein [Gilvimarinus agarilyticus]MDO6570131.1 cellulose binding domain-containing protein [Gilvimarinus sp. 2_MG-2023]
MISTIRVYPLILSLALMLTLAQFATGEDLVLLYPEGSAKFLDSDSNGDFETISEQPSSLSVRKFDSILQEVSTACYYFEGDSYDVNSAALSIQIAGYTSNSNPVNINAFSSSSAFFPEGTVSPAITIASYDPTALGLGSHSISLDSDTLNTVQFNDNSYLCLRFEASASSVNTQLQANPSLEMTVVEAPPSEAENLNIASSLSTKLIDNDVDGIFEEITENPSSLSVRTFNALKEVSIACHYVDTQLTEVVDASISLYVAGFSNNTSNVEIDLLNFQHFLDSEAAADHGIYLGNYNPTSLGLGTHEIQLDETSIELEDFNQNYLCLRYSSDEYAANTQLHSNPVLQLSVKEADSSSSNIDDVTAIYTINNDWGSGYCANILITNSGSSAELWAVDLEVEGTINNLWNGIYNQSGSALTLSGLSWNNTLQPGQTDSSIGFCASR